MKSNLRRGVTFLGFLILCAGLAWLNGYDFDHRGSSVAMGVFMSIWVSVACCLFVEILVSPHD